MMERVTAEADRDAAEPHPRQRDDDSVDTQDSLQPGAGLPADDLMTTPPAPLIGHSLTFNTYQLELASRE